MKDFEVFTTYVVKKWRGDKVALLASTGLNGLSNREYGDLAEIFVQKKLNPNYKAFITTGSQSPADIIAVARRNGYWHIMLVRVKSSNDKKNIYKLTTDDKKAFDIFAKFLKKEIGGFSLYKNYVDKPIIITTGLAGVLRSSGKKM